MEKNLGRSFAFSSYIFETRAGELMRGGRRIRIPDQAARLLTILLENPGNVVTREELKRELWPDGQLQDYDHSIHRVVSQLREVLRDHSSKNTQYIETLPKRGYRFAVAVKEFPPPSEAAPGPSIAEGSASDWTPSAPELEGAFPIAVPDNELPQSGFPKALDQVPPQPVEAPRVHSRLAIGAAIFLLLVAGLGIWGWHLWKSSLSSPLSLGIVPFETSGDRAAPIAESLRLNLADVLSQSPAIETRAVHSFDHFGADESQVFARARQVGVQLLIFGKFTVSGDDCELDLELVRSRDGVHLSSFHYNGKLQELASISDRVERDLFERLRPGRKAVALNPIRPSSEAAYEAYLRGRGYLQQWTDDNLHLAIQAFQQAVREDPSYGRAYAGLASAFFVLSQHGGKDAAQNLDRCQEFATRAIALNPQLAEAHAMLGQSALNRDWNFALAEQQLHQAIELDPDHAVYHQWLAILYGIEGKHELSLNEIDKAHSADPNWAPLYMTDIFLASTAGNFQRANRAADRLMREMPAWSLAHEQHAMSLWDQGMYEKAIDEWRQAALLERNMDRAHLEEAGAAALKAGGVSAYARLRLHAITTHRGISHEEQDFVPAEWHAYAGDWEEALAELNASVADRSPSALQISSNPAYKHLRDDPRFTALLKRIGLPDRSNPGS